MNAVIETTFLGKTDLRISSLGLGAWAWGDRLVWGYGSDYAREDVAAAFETSLAAGINWVDTAEVYGRGQSERILGELFKTTQERIIVATKFSPQPWRLARGDLVKALRASLNRLGLEQVDLYQVHWPYPPIPVEVWAGALADAVELGLTRTVGVSNYNVEQMSRTHAVLTRRGISLASNQVEYSLINRSIERTGLLALCQQLGIKVIAYSPLAKGVLTGKYTPENPLPGLRRYLYPRSYLTALQPLIKTMRQIGAVHGDKTPGQVALNWAICKGAVPIPGAKNASQAAENAGALGWRLDLTETMLLDELSDTLTSQS
jgi:aryl-alcohol dehydrogenase-like predicted oxidoreductase